MKPFWGTTGLARSTVVKICSRSSSTRPVGMLWGVPRYQEQERNRAATVPGPTRTAVNCRQPVMCRGFSISAGQQSVWITLGVK